MEVSKAEFQGFWTNRGYGESFNAVGYEMLPDALPRVMDGCANPKATAVDIGCGGGFLTMRWLAPRFGRVIGVDLITSPSELRPPVEYIEVGDRDYTCCKIPSNSIDFVFSIGLFCHLPNSALQAYLHTIYRILKPSGVALLVFGNWEKHPDLQHCMEQGRAHHRENCTTDGGVWFFCDYATVAVLTANTGFKTFTQIIPECRDIVGLFVK